MDQDLSRRLSHIEEKLDRIVDTLQSTGEGAKIHAAICDEDRKNVREDITESKKRLDAQDRRWWKLAAFMAGSGVLGNAAVTFAKGLFP